MIFNSGNISIIEYNFSMTNIVLNTYHKEGRAIDTGVSETLSKTEQALTQNQSGIPREFKSQVKMFW